MANQYTREFKQDAVNYVHEHPDLTIQDCADNLGLKYSTLYGWVSKARKGEEFRGQGNYASDEAKEIARLKRELRDANDAIKILKKTLRIIND